MHRHRKPGLIHLNTDMSLLHRTTKPLYLLGLCTVLLTGASAEEAKTNPLLTALSPTTISGYVSSSVGVTDVTANYLAPVGSEFLICGIQPGDQVYPSIALTPDQGVITWEDNGIDKNGAGIGARRFLSSTLTTSPTNIHVNLVAVGDQVTPQAVCLHTNKMTLFVWQSMALATPDIYARLMKSNGLFASSDVRVNTYIKDAQSHPAAAALADGSAIIVWQSAWQDGCPNGIFARKIGATGLMTPVREFEVNQFNDSYNARPQRGNRRRPAVALLANGNFVVTWVSELQRTPTSVDIYGRIFSPTLTPVTDEFLINSSTSTCADPAVVGLGDGGFTAAWSERDLLTRTTNGWDVVARSFSSDGTAKGDQFVINTFRFGDQYIPKLAACPSGVMAVWTSMGQDGSREGVFAQFLLGGNQLAGPEIMVNTTRVSQQIQPVVSWNGVDRFLVVWSSFGATHGFDLYGQVYVVNSL
ncbi:MAG: uncharacterized protein JWO95_3389 [Verrucomicrobiales bacterium]|nr:uncharacterized protein [Verrucomicrobiales bacterium]